ncbi:MAG: viroplasmin family protein [Pseudobutyrivibrio sp.]|nr:viroplasmin family protein [Pseudobutyrivibrio sp.]
MEKYYAIKVGKQTGIFNTWDECKELVSGYPNAKYKSFKSESEAIAYLHSGQTSMASNTTEELVLPDVYAFVDGSFNTATGVYGYGGFVVVKGDKHLIMGQGSEPEMSSMRNVAGEISGAMAAVKKAMDLGVDHMTIYYDYEGINAWVSGDWQAKNTCTQSYAATMHDAMSHGLSLSFVHVKGHTGIPGNEEADMLAKEACGVV